MISCNELSITLSTLYLLYSIASQRLGILRNSWRVFHDRLLIGRCFGVLSFQLWNTVLQCGVRLAIHTLNYWTAQSVVPVLQLVAWLTVIFPIVDLWQCSVCCTRSSVTRSTHFNCGALPVPYVPFRVTRGALIALWRTGCVATKWWISKESYDQNLYSG